MSQVKTKAEGSPDLTMRFRVTVSLLETTHRRSRFSDPEYSPITFHQVTPRSMAVRICVLIHSGCDVMIKQALEESMPVTTRSRALSDT